MSKKLIDSIIKDTAVLSFKVIKEITTEYENGNKITKYKIEYDTQADANIGGNMLSPSPFINDEWFAYPMKSIITIFNKGKLKFDVGEEYTAEVKLNTNDKGTKGFIVSGV